MAVLGPRGPGFAHRKYEPYDIQEMQIWKEKAKQASMALETNVNVIACLGKFYARLASNRDFPPELGRQTEEDVESFVANLDEIMDGMKMHVSRLRFLMDVISDRSVLVSYPWPKLSSE
jgi:hypothetical protein